MKGLELSEKFYLEYGAPMIREQFPALESVIAVGLTGSGSECFGYDDELSADHDFEPGFCIFIPDETIISRKEEFAIERAYSRLPKEFMGYKRSPLSPVGGNRHGVIRIEDFLRSKTGKPDGNLSLSDWLFIPEQSAAEAVNGKLFRDDSGYFSAIRNKLSYMPEDVRLKKLAGELLVMGQSGQYNYPRCIQRGDSASAQLCICEFVKATIHVVFLVNKVYEPYYKWQFKALSALPRLSNLSADLEYLISSENGKDEAARKTGVVESICFSIISELGKLELTDYSGTEAEGHAYSINGKIENGDVRNLHILYAV